MSVNINYCPNGYFVPCGGYPFELSMQVDSAMEGLIPKGATSISALVCAVNGSCNIYAAIYEPPTTSGGAAGDLVDDESIANLTGTGQTLTLTLPEVTVPVNYIYRLWFDGVSSSPTANSSFTNKYADTNAFGYYGGTSATRNTDSIVKVLVGAITVDFTTSVYLSSASEVSSLSGDSLGAGI